VPREFLESKPVASADEYLNARLFPTTYASGTGFSFSLMGEPYLNFGALGVAIVLYLLGLAASWLARWYAAGAQSSREIVIYAAAVPFIFVFMRGGLGVDYHRMLISVLPLLYVTASLRSASHDRRPATIRRAGRP
jgi:hypothetical protein